MGRGVQWLMYIAIESGSEIQREYPYLEIVMHPSHCWDCADWYVFRKLDGSIWYDRVLGDSSTVTQITEEGLEALTLDDIDDPDRRK